MVKTFHFVAGEEDDMVVALCLEHDFVVHAFDMDDIREACREMIQIAYQIDLEQGHALRPTPLAEDVEEFRAMPNFTEFSLEVEV